MKRYVYKRPIFFLYCWHGRDCVAWACVGVGKSMGRWHERCFSPNGQSCAVAVEQIRILRRALPAMRMIGVV